MSNLQAIGVIALFVFFVVLPAIGFDSDIDEQSYWEMLRSGLVHVAAMAFACAVVAVAAFAVFSVAG